MHALTFRQIGFAVVILLALVFSYGRADVFNMSADQTSLQFITVGNPGNAMDTTGFGAVGYTYSIGKYEVTAGQYTEFLNAVAGTDTYGLYNIAMCDANGWLGCGIQRTVSQGTCTYSVGSDWANLPVNSINFWNACRFANWLHNGQPTGVQGPGTTEDGAYVSLGNETAFARQPGARYWIPSEDEWYKAAYHKNDGVTGNYWDYPTKTNSVPSNDHLTPDQGNNANFQISEGDYTIGGSYWRTPVGDFENSDSPYGTFDQGGNLWEWTDTAAAGAWRPLRGGSFDANLSSLIASSNRYLNDPATGYNIYGFRVAYVPEPSTLVLLDAVVVGLFSWVWWKRNWPRVGSVRG
jgi:formylglycine-generating enzyme required for sulfatase activity